MGITLVPEALARKGAEFYYVGPMDGCDGCRLIGVCFNLDVGRRYKVAEIRSQSHECPQLGDERVIAVSVEEVATPGAVPKKEAMEGVTFTYSTPRCDRPGCPNFRLCHIPGTEDGDKRTVVRLGRELECPAGERMVDADVRRRPHLALYGRGETGLSESTVPMGESPADVVSILMTDQAMRAERGGAMHRPGPSCLARKVCKHQGSVDRQHPGSRSGPSDRPRMVRRDNRPSSM